MITKGRRFRRIRRWPLLGLGGGGAAACVIAVSVALGQLPSGAAYAAAVSAAGSVGSASGIATHYVLQGGGGGNCSYPGAPANHLFAALPTPEYGGAAACGIYLEVKGPHGSVRVQVIDRCPECKGGHIDLSVQAFARLAPLSAGIIPVAYRVIANPPLPGPVAVLVKNGSSRYWLALVVMNTGNAIASVQLETAPGRWLKLMHANWNAWIAPRGAGPGPFTIRVTDTRHHRVAIHNIALRPNAVQNTGTWMYGHH